MECTHDNYRHSHGAVAGNIQEAAAAQKGDDNAEL
nr:MAG TPA: Transcriptional regulator protein (SplA) [Caudoviricetes sp.]